jgi:hypothetical protein
MADVRTDRTLAWALAAATLGQGLMLVYLGNLGGRVALGCVLTSVAVALAMQQAWWHRMELNHRADMALVMGAFGGFGMILGWWADFGFGQAPSWLRFGGPPPHPWSFSDKVISFMTLGMLVAAIPPSLLLTRCAQRARESRRLWFSTHIIGNLAMIAGMIWTNRWIGRSLGRVTGSPVLGAHLAMLLGMVTGMVAGMWFGEALLGLRPWRRLRPPEPTGRNQVAPP